MGVVAAKWLVHSSHDRNDQGQGSVPAKSFTNRYTERKKKKQEQKRQFKTHQKKQKLRWSKEKETRKDLQRKKNKLEFIKTRIEEQTEKIPIRKY